MRKLCVLALVMGGCGSDTPDPTGYVDVVWDGSQLTVDALYEINEEHSVTEILVDRAEASFRGQTYTLERVDYPPPTLYPAYHYVATVPLDSAPAEDEVITVTADDIAPAATTIPTAFEISATPPSPSSLPVTISWSPVAPVPMEWWITTPCNTDRPSGERIQVPRGDDTTLADLGHLIVDALDTYDGSTTCEVTVSIDRYRSEGTTRGAQRRSVTFTANVN